MRDFTRVGSGSSVCGRLLLLGKLSATTMLQLGSALSLRSYVRIGSGVSILGNVLVASNLSMMQEFEVASSLSVRGWTRLGDAVSFVSALNEFESKMGLKKSSNTSRSKGLL